MSPLSLSLNRFGLGEQQFAVAVAVRSVPRQPGLVRLRRVEFLGRHETRNPKRDEGGGGDIVFGERTAKYFRGGGSFPRKQSQVPLRYSLNR
jgi:hypothetical protein